MAAVEADAVAATEREEAQAPVERLAPVSLGLMGMLHPQRGLSHRDITKRQS